MVTSVAGRSVFVSTFVCLPLGQIFGKFFAYLGFMGVPWGHIKGTWTLKMVTWGTPFGGWGPHGQIFSEFGMYFGSHFGTHFAHWQPLVTTFASFWHPFFNDVFRMVSGTCPGRANVAKTL